MFEHLYSGKCLFEESKCNVCLELVPSHQVSNHFCYIKKLLELYQSVTLKSSRIVEGVLNDKHVKEAKRRAMSPNNKGHLEGLLSVINKLV